MTKLFSHQNLLYLGALFNALNGQLAQLRMKYLTVPKRRWLGVVEVGFVVIVTTMLTFGSVITVGTLLNNPAFYSFL